MLTVLFIRLSVIISKSLMISVVYLMHLCQLTMLLCILIQAPLTEILVLWSLMLVRLLVKRTIHDRRLVILLRTPVMLNLVLCFVPVGVSCVVLELVF